MQRGGRSSAPQNKILYSQFYYRGPEPVRSVMRECDCAIAALHLGDEVNLGKSVRKEGVQNKKKKEKISNKGEDFKK